ncbi:DUF6786 family protein [Paenibacillus eucommiae]|uniref:DUF4380 domain-containing protein n=1 Tax=Paenibacillus eucommiae TaxID=1355755 RepID=A0ABS4J2H0_9BACL|nr:DUF6786 family protein [Paenibacillus eucommiae]MBP1994005.1 hypothetical protein [Paenibacillus eucommiae]
MKFKKLVNVLEQVGLRYAVINGEHGGALVLLERGARVIGIYAEGEAENSLWVHPLLEDVRQAKTHFQDEQHWNIGGDRTWVSPEVEFFISNVEAFWDTYKVPAAIDPGAYVMSDGDFGREEKSWSQSAALFAYRSQLELDFHLQKKLRLVPDPLRFTSYNSSFGSYSYIGYELDIRLSIPAEAPSAPLSLWNLLQLPAGGEVRIPTYGQADVTDFFAPTGPSHLKVTPGLVSFRLDAKEQHKISIKAPFITGRMGYMREGAEGEAYLLVRQFQVNPSADYPDVPADRLDDQGHCVQCYNDSGELGAFGEMEYHSPALSIKSKDKELQDRSQIWCYNGKAADIEVISGQLLGK